MGDARPKVDVEKLTESLRRFNDALKRFSVAVAKADENQRERNARISKLLDSKR